MQVLYRKS